MESSEDTSTHYNITTMSFATNTPIQYLPGIGWRTAKVMHELGVHTAGQLNAMPEKVLVELFGPSIKPVISRISISTPTKKKHTTTYSTKPVIKKKSLSQRLRMAATVMTML